MMLAKFFPALLILAAFLGCSQTNERADNDLKSFTIENVDSDYNLVFNFPRSFVSIKEMNKFDHLDTTDINLNWIFNVQYENSDLDCFYDSLDTRSNIIIRAGPRVDISNKERRMTYLTVPTISLDKVFPQASDSVKIIYESGKKTYKDKTYFKRRYKKAFDEGRTSDFYYVSTKWHSALVIVNSPGNVNMDKHILDYAAHPSD